MAREVRNILAARARWAGDEVVLGTVVDVAGSAYRQPGARMLLRRSGERVGLISGGCLERDLINQAFALTADGPQTVMYDTRGDRLNPQGQYGSGCDGVVHLFLERLDPDGESLGLEALTTTLQRRQSRVLATLFGTPEHHDESTGAQAVLVGEKWRHSSAWPEVIGSELRDIMGRAQRWRRPRTVRLERGSQVFSCLIEPLRPPLDLVVFGAGDDVQPVVALADAMGWDIRIVDQWPLWATRQRFPQARQVRCGPPETWVESLAIDSSSYVVLMTHDFEADRTVLPEVLAREPAFVGLLGPRRRTMRLVEQLHMGDQLPDPALLDRVQTPLGLDLGGEAPSEVALSVVSGVQAARHGRSGGLLKSSSGSIHDDHRRLTIQEQL